MGIITRRMAALRIIKMLVKIIPLLFVCARLCDAVVYDRFTGKVATEKQLAKYDEIGAMSTCTMDIKPCDPTEHRRVDGSCNSLDNPAKGTFFEPVKRVLPAHYFNGSYPRKAADGTDLGNPRHIRNLLLCVGEENNADFTQAIPGFAVFTFGDIGSIHDILYFLQNKTDCCTAEGMKSPMCTPNIIPEDDPVHRFDDIRCMNLTKPLTYSDFGCTDDPEPAPVEEATGVFDLSTIYNVLGKGDSVIRSYVDGKLNVEVDKKGIIWPPNGDHENCFANQPGETRCFKNYANTLLGVSLFTIWYVRHHNYIASELAAVNPHWDDEKLFYTARDINIAFNAELYMYEWLPALMGEEYLIKQGVISDCKGHRDIYDDSLYPIVSLEYAFNFRWFHTLQHGSANMYDTDGNFLKEYPFVNITMRTGFLDIDNNLVHLTQQMFRQPCAPYKAMVHPDLADNGLPYTQRAVDIVTSDLHKTRLMGFAPYIDYVEYCTGHKINSFEDLEPHMDKGKIGQMKKAYKHVSDIELIPGLWTENKIEGGSVPATFACLLTDHLRDAVRSDRHWYELSDRPHAFTKEQLMEVRKASLASLICTNADGVKEVQPNAFLNIDSETNPLTPCSEIPSIDFTKWADDSCSSDDSSSSEDSQEYESRRRVRQHGGRRKAAPQHASSSARSHSERY